MKQLISSDQAVHAKRQHKTPCSDCPWARTALNGWLGGAAVEDWLREAHGERQVPCHTLNGAQCAGIAIYRRNVCKSPRNPDALCLPADREKVFSSPMEFTAHHTAPLRALARAEGGA